MDLQLSLMAVNLGDVARSGKPSNKKNRKRVVGDSSQNQFVTYHKRRSSHIKLMVEAEGVYASEALRAALQREGFVLSFNQGGSHLCAIHAGDAEREIRILG